MTAREAAHRLFGTPLDPADDQKPDPEQRTPNQRMNALLLEATHKHGKQKPNET
jgi:hypothetical protein